MLLPRITSCCSITEKMGVSFILASWLDKSISNWSCFHTMTVTSSSSSHGHGAEHIGKGPSEINSDMVRVRSTVAKIVESRAGLGLRKLASSASLPSTSA